MKNTIKLIAAGAVAITAICSASAAQNVVVGGNGSESFVGSMKITPGQYVSVAGFGTTVSETINPVTIAGTHITQINDSTVSNTTSTSTKYTNKTVLAEIYGDAVPKGAKLVWVIEGAGNFEDGVLGGLVKSGSSYTFTRAGISVFNSADLAANLVVSKKSTKTTKKGVTTTTTIYSAEVANVELTQIPVSGVGSITEVDVTGGTPELKVNVTLPLSGTIVD
jgi:hypothetical protein